MQILSQQTHNCGLPYYTNQWRGEDVERFLNGVGLVKGELVAIYSAPKDWDSTWEEEKEFRAKCELYGHTLPEDLTPERLRARMWAQSWRGYARLIREKGGLPIVLVMGDSTIEPHMQDELMKSLNAEVITIEEWRKRGGKWQGE